MTRILLFPLLLLLGCTTPPAAPQDAPANVILITLDGLRWQELFTGADPWLIRHTNYVRDTTALKARFWTDDPAARRERLLPFFWRTIAREGQLYGNRLLGAHVDVTNGHRFSYPGYNEILSGRADDGRIDSNDKVDNPNVTVLEAVHNAPGFRGRVAAFGSWDVFPYIVNERRSGIPVNAGFRVAEGDDLSAREHFLNELQPQIPSPWATVRLDAFAHHYALEHLKKNRPRLLYIAYGETDDFAHDGRYDAYLTSAHQTDAFIAELWAWTQADDQYRGRTTFIITTDHGRGEREAWTSHGSSVDGAEHIWLALLGPQASALGEATSPSQHYQNQVAATVAALLNVPFTPGPGGGDPIAEAMGR